MSHTTIQTSLSQLAELRMILDEIEPHTHREHQNECLICEEPIIDAATRVLKKLHESLSPADKPETKTCRWSNQENEGIWESECGLEWILTTCEPPSEHGMSYCPKCGDKLIDESAAVIGGES